MGHEYRQTDFSRPTPLTTPILISTIAQFILQPRRRGRCHSIGPTLRNIFGHGHSSLRACLRGANWRWVPTDRFEFHPNSTFFVFITRSNQADECPRRTCLFAHLTESFSEISDRTTRSSIKVLGIGEIPLFNREIVSVCVERHEVPRRRSKTNDGGDEERKKN